VVISYNILHIIDDHTITIKGVLFVIIIVILSAKTKDKDN